MLEPFVETYVYSPYRSAALSELGLAYLNLGDKKKSLSYYDMVVKTAPQSSDAKDALQGFGIFTSPKEMPAVISIMPGRAVPKGTLRPCRAIRFRSLPPAGSIFRASLRRRPSRCAVISKVIPRDIIRPMRSIV